MNKIECVRLPLGQVTHEDEVLASACIRITVVVLSIISIIIGALILSQTPVLSQCGPAAGWSMCYGGLALGIITSFFAGIKRIPEILVVKYQSESGSGEMRFENRSDYYTWQKRIKEIEDEGGPLMTHETVTILSPVPT